MLVIDSNPTATPVSGTEGVTRWTVVAEYTSIARSSSVYTTPGVVGGAVSPQLTTSTTAVATSTDYTIISGQREALVIGPNIALRWASTDQAVLDWLRTHTGSSAPPPPPNNTTPVEPPPPKPSDGGGISGGAIAGIVVGAIAGLALVIAALLLCLRRRKRRATAEQYRGEVAQGMSHCSYR